ncbi:MAG: hypothetical protein EAZ32_03255 [Cytophagia bacterium]|nr:MAG: hypothetical protein EAZ38_06050 [Cytophagales bacterium]TAG41372.1 MAG: hypothetical protein EAZ32_03255 [Cytophagia bacterium]TAG83130.1 MAG: hypothetical protein EAZ22_03625 [Cytophagales bacterium]
MKKLFFVLRTFVIPTFSFVVPTIGGILTATTTASAQTDSLRYTQESGTLKEQRFIDRYDYVFMTKEPTKWMGKILLGMTSNPIKGLILNLEIGVEYKLSPSFSLGINATAPSGSSGYYNSLIYNNVNTEVRWYYDMKKRKRANNFSGNYFDLHYGRAVVFSNSINDSAPLTMPGGAILFSVPSSNIIPTRQIGAGFGLQRRFSGALFFDFGLQITHSTFDKYTLDPNQQMRHERYSSLGFLTEWRYGLAIGSWKRNKRKNLTYDIINYYEEQKGMWKLGWPLLQIAPGRQNLILGLGYEHKIAKSPVSIHAEVTQNYDRSLNSNYVGYSFDENLRKHIRVYEGNQQLTRSSTLLALQGRYNLSHRQKMVNDLSGIYVGVNSTYEWTTQNQVFDDEKLNSNSSGEIWRAGLLLGFQYRLFKHGFIDAYAPINFTIQKKSSYLPSVRIPVNIRIGFAF